MFNKESLFRLNSQGKPILSAPLNGSIVGVEERPAISWGDPGRNDDWITPIYIIELILSEEDKKQRI